MSKREKELQKAINEVKKLMKSGEFVYIEKK